MDEPLARTRDTAISNDDLYEMVNLYRRLTGLPMTIWASPRGRARHAARIKVCLRHGDRMVADETAVVSVWRPPTLLAGRLSAADLAAVTEWMRLNEDALLAFWEDGDVAAFLPRLRQARRQT